MRTGVGLVLSAVILAAGIAVSGYLIGDGFLKGREATRSVTVRGLSERVVRADVAEWPLQLSAANDDLSIAQAAIEEDIAEVQRFFADAGLPPRDLIRQRLQVTDQLAERYNNGQIRNNRFIITQTLMVRSEDVDLIEALSRRTGELAARGVVVTDNQGPSFTFTDLSGIKPDMVAEATRDARAAAEQFALDSGSAVGPILKASQGYFSVEPLIASNPYGGGGEQIDKKVRVVTTVDFRLED